MILNFEHTINLTTDTKNVAPLILPRLCIIDEPDGEINQYYLLSNMANNKSVDSEPRNYLDLYWYNSSKKLSSRVLSRIGLKSFPGIGAAAFFKYKYEGTSVLLAPVNSDRVLHSAPTLAMSVGSSTITFTITPPSGITYTCFRIVLRSDPFAYEYVTYELNIEVPIPDVIGTYEIFCVGYVNEGGRISNESNILTHTVSTGQTDWGPKNNQSYYTKEQIDAMFASLINYTGDTETIDVTAGVISVNSTYRTLIENI